MFHSMLLLFGEEVLWFSGQFITLSTYCTYYKYSRMVNVSLSFCQVLNILASPDLVKVVIEFCLKLIVLDQRQDSVIVHEL